VMPVLHNISVTLEIEKVLRRQGLGNRSKIRPWIMALVPELLAAAKRHLLEPAVVYEYYPVTRIEGDRLSLGGGPIFHGDFIAKGLASAVEAALAVCTIGACLEDKVTEYFTQDPLRATLLDGIGSAAVDALSRKVCQFIHRKAEARGYETSSPFSPGIQGFPLAAQSDLCRFVGAERIGVSLTSAAMMVPRKSASMVIGLGKRMPVWTQAQACEICALKRSCHDRVLQPSSPFPL